MGKGASAMRSGGWRFEVEGGKALGYGYPGASSRRFLGRHGRQVLRVMVCTATLVLLLTAVMASIARLGSMSYGDWSL